MLSAVGFPGVALQNGDGARELQEISAFLVHSERVWGSPFVGLCKAAVAEKVLLHSNIDLGLAFHRSNHMRGIS